jgi:hypothetical protein
MKHFLTWVFVIALTISAIGAENPLAISVLAAESSGSSAYLLLSIANTSSRRYEVTTWRCVFLSGGNPVHEEESSVKNVLPQSYTLKREIKSYAGPFDKVECRFLRSRPSASLSR